MNQLSPVQFVCPMGYFIVACFYTITQYFKTLFQKSPPPPLKGTQAWEFFGSDFELFTFLWLVMPN